MSKLSRRKLIGSGVAATGALAMPNVARAQTVRWRMVTSWPKRLPGPGMSAERVAERIATLSGGRIQITVHAAGEIVPALETLDAVSSGTAEMAHTAAFYWQGKQPASAFFTTVPFGMTPAEHTGWIDAGGGQALWDELYKLFGVKPFMAGNTGVCMGGWFRNEIADAAVLKGMKIRSLGLGGEIYRRLGAVPLTTSPGEIITGLQSGLVDGAEFVGPGSDIALGLYRLAPNYYGPGFNKPNGTGECIVSLKVWDALDSQQKAIVAHACAAEAAFALNEMERLNVEALAALTERNGVKLRTFPPAMIEAARGHAKDITGEIAGKSEIARKIVESYAGFLERAGKWANVSVRAVLDSRGSL
jgi:TRAP-type mannitol/chloroaromatic compound transport system substrate-binding protein